MLAEVTVHAELLTLHHRGNAHGTKMKAKGWSRKELSVIDTSSTFVFVIYANFRLINLASMDHHAGECSIALKKVWGKSRDVVHAGDGRPCGDDKDNRLKY